VNKICIFALCGVSYGSVGKIYANGIDGGKTNGVWAVCRRPAGRRNNNNNKNNNGAKSFCGDHHFYSSSILLFTMLLSENHTFVYAVILKSCVNCELNTTMKYEYLEFLDTTTHVLVYFPSIPDTSKTMKKILF
jgi:hypothetical protein